MSNYPTPILDPRLTADMERVRSGSTQLFRVLGNHRSFINEDNADVVLTPPERHLYADLVNGEWHWVNGCEECNGRPRNTAKSYIECDAHNVCCTCGTPRAELKEAPWGCIDGWQCKPCADAEHEAEKAAALAAMPSDEDYDPWDYEGCDRIKCPYCNADIDSDDHYDAIENPRDITCYRCGNTFKLAGETHITWTMTKVDEGGAA